jgi:L-seryl-tRNA(Ser) seleniumtransferase
VDVAMFSGDKLLGGPQCGIIVGKKKYVDKIRKHHLMRAMRCDKMTLAALSATLRLYLQPATLPQHLPAHAMLSTSVAELTRRAELVCRSINNPNIQIEITEADSQIGSGALPLKTIPSVALAISGGAKSEHYHQQLRDFRTPVIAYIRNDRLLVNLRTILERDTEELINAINALH